MDGIGKKKQLARVPTRSLLASLKQDIRRQIQASASVPKSKKAK